MLHELVVGLVALFITGLIAFTIGYGRRGPKIFFGLLIITKWILIDQWIFLLKLKLIERKLDKQSVRIAESLERCSKDEPR